MPRLARTRYFMPDPTMALTDKEIMKHVPGGSRVLDLGCGDGRLLEILRDVHQCRVQGVELEPREIIACIDRGVPVIHGDLDHGLPEFPDDSFDYAVLSQTLQQLKFPKRVLEEILRIVAAAGLVAVLELQLLEGPAPASLQRAGTQSHKQLAIRVVQHAQFALHVDVRLSRPGSASGHSHYQRIAHHSGTRGRSRLGRESAGRKRALRARAARKPHLGPRLALLVPQGLLDTPHSHGRGSKSENLREKCHCGGTRRNAVFAREASRNRAGWRDLSPGTRRSVWLRGRLVPMTQPKTSIIPIVTIVARFLQTGRRIAPQTVGEKPRPPRNAGVDRTSCLRRLLAHAT